LPGDGFEMESMRTGVNALWLVRRYTRLAAHRLDHATNRHLYEMLIETSFGRDPAALIDCIISAKDHEKPYKSLKTALEEKGQSPDIGVLMALASAETQQSVVEGLIEAQQRIASRCFKRILEYRKAKAELATLILEAAMVEDDE
jgi:hypothetical protein